LLCPELKRAQHTGFRRSKSMENSWRIPANRSAEPNSLAVRVDFDDRAELLATNPDVYYVTDHYVGYSAVLVRLSCVNPDVLRDLLGMAYKFVTRKPAPRSPARKRGK